MDQPRIQRLPENAISELRSTVSLTSLAGVVQGLLMNSLDANAANVTININIQKNSAIVEDDGDGVVPSDISYLGTRYTTSKSLFSSNQTFGSHGEFLSSLATSSLLTVYSRSKHHRSTHATRYHYGSRLICGQVENDTLVLRNSGTRVIVDRLFGNYPVRMMGRENMTSIDISREWKEIGRAIVEVLLLLNRGVKITIRDEKGTRKALFDMSDTVTGKLRWGTILEQAGYARTAWESVEAEWHGVHLRGMMGLTPQVDTEKQYIFLNGFPMSKAGHATLYTKINNIFAASSFGTLDDTNPSEDGKRLVSRKGSDKHPSFVMFIQTALSIVHAEDLELDSGNIVLANVTQLLQSVVDEFLSFGGWKRRNTPRKQRISEDVEMSVDSIPFRYDHMRADNLLDMTVASKMKTSGELQFKRTSEYLEGISVKKTKISKKSVEMMRPSNFTYRDATDNTVPLDPRTGNQVQPDFSTALSRKRVTLFPPQVEASSRASAWAANVLSSFKNPTYGVSETTIPCHSISTDDVADSDTGHLSKISKESLKSARVISQVDDKYILLLLNSPDMLVILDQHAADERIRVEKLWAEYDNRPKPLRKPISFHISIDEYTTLAPYVLGMKDWGYEFEVSASRERAKVDISGAPELVADRCQSEPLFVGGLLRAWMADIKENSSFKRFPRDGDWWKKMVNASKGLSEVVSSRACRSAIMFNDKLTHSECKELIELLAQCDFPFQCAHGRPSMVPLINLTDDAVQERFCEDNCGSDAPQSLLVNMNRLSSS